MPKMCEGEWKLCSSASYLRIIPVLPRTFLFSPVLGLILVLNFRTFPNEKYLKINLDHYLYVMLSYYCNVK